MTVIFDEFWAIEKKIEEAQIELKRLRRSRRALAISLREAGWKNKEIGDYLGIPSNKVGHLFSNPSGKPGYN